MANLCDIVHPERCAHRTKHLPVSLIPVKTRNTLNTSSFPINAWTVSHTVLLKSKSTHSKLDTHIRGISTASYSYCLYISQNTVMWLLVR